MSLPHMINKRLNISYINVWTINPTVLELDFVANNLFVFLFFHQWDSNPLHHRFA